MEFKAVNNFLRIVPSGIILLFLLSASVEANDIITGGSGESNCYDISIEYNLSPNINYNIAGIIKLSNSSLLYLNNLSLICKGTFSDKLLDRVNDSIYQFSFNFKPIDPIDSILFDLCTDVLAGNDSICDITFENFTVNQENINNDTIRFIRRSGQYEPLYFRQVMFDIIDEHPVTDGTIRLKVMIDCEGPVKFLMFDLMGKLSLTEDAYYNTAGHYAEHEIILSNTLSSGIYMLQLHTHCGGALREVIIIK